MLSAIINPRNTSQKEIIFEYLQSVKTHPSAEDVYSKVKRKLPRVSLGTVYRILKNFKEEGKAQEIPAGGISHFDANISSHAHFICQDCNRVFDVFEGICENCGIVKSKKTKVGKIENYRVNFYGYCKNCQKK